MLKGGLVLIWELDMNLVPTPLHSPESNYIGASLYFEENDPRNF